MSQAVYCFDLVTEEGFLLDDLLCNSRKSVSIAEIVLLDANVPDLEGSAHHALLAGTRNT